MTNRNITPADEANAKRLYALWQAKKMAMGLTQTSAAQKLGYKSQSMVSMQLKGEVALNTDAILKWAQLLGVNPGDIDPELKGLNFSASMMRRVKVAIVAKLSGKSCGAFETVEIMTQMTRQVYGISVDVTGFEPFAKRGSTLVVSLEEDPVSGDEVFIRLSAERGHAHLIKTFVTVDNTRQVAIVRSLGGSTHEEIALDDIEIMDPIVCVERPTVNRPIRLHPRSSVS